jgi:pimeloyl-ACP methyl ester carboxylesterase
MTSLASDPQFHTRDDGVRLAYRHLPGKGPTIVFLPGYMSDMQALATWAEREGHAMLRLDYSGCGESEGAFEDGTLDIWRDDVLAVVRHVVIGPIIFVGSSMGGWLMLLAAEALGDQVAALVGVAAAPDFTEWEYSEAEKAEIVAKGRFVRPLSGHYDYEPMVTTRHFWESGQANLRLNGEIPFTFPVRLLHGQQDADVPWEKSLRLAQKLRSSDVQTILIKDGDHRLSRDQDIEMLIDVVSKLL